MPKGPRPSRAWEHDHIELGETEAAVRTRIQAQDNAFQAALRAAGVKEGVNKSYPENSRAVRISPTRLDLLKTSLT